MRVWKEIRLFNFWKRNTTQLEGKSENILVTSVEEMKYTMA